jgi:hypothetical protein
MYICQKSLPCNKRLIHGGEGLKPSGPLFILRADYHLPALLWRVLMSLIHLVDLIESSSIFKKEKKKTTTNRNLLWSSMVEILVFCTEMFTVCVFKEASFIFIFFSDWICRIISSNFNSNKNVFVLNTMCCQPTFTFTVNCFMT